MKDKAKAEKRVGIIVTARTVVLVWLLEGPQGQVGGILNLADFYALMPPDNAAPVAIGADVDFPQDGPNSGTDITRLGADSFNLAQIGTYQIQFHVSIDEAAQLILTLNGEDLEYISGRRHEIRIGTSFDYSDSVSFN